MEASFCEDVNLLNTGKVMAYECTNPASLEIDTRDDYLHSLVWQAKGVNNPFLELDFNPLECPLGLNGNEIVSYDVSYINFDSDACWKNSTLIASFTQTVIDGTEEIIGESQPIEVLPTQHDARISFNVRFSTASRLDPLVASALTRGQLNAAVMQEEMIHEMDNQISSYLEPVLG